MSWTRQDQRRYRFLALRDADGHILGIDQLFGDNTFGPDAQRPFAKDGFHALMKYDTNDNYTGGEFAGSDMPDGYIDNGDSIFSQLRLWHDENGDGNCDTPEEIRTELAPLSAFGITFIHLLPNEKFFETDKYGNDIAYKSIVGFQTAEGRFKYGTAFDMWFQYDPREILNINGGTRVSQ